MQSNTQNDQAPCLEALLNPSADIDELLDLASKFSIGQLILSRAAQKLLVRLLEREAKRLLRPGDEIRQLNVSVKKKRMETLAFCFGVASSATRIAAGN